MSVADRMESLEGLIRSHLSALLAAIPRVPEEFSRAMTIARSDVNSGRPGLVLAILIGLILFGYAAEYVVRWALADRSIGGRSAEGTSTLQRGVFTELPSLLVFAIASAGLFLVFEWPPLLRKIVLTLLAAFILFRLVMAVTRVVVAESRPVADGAEVAHIPAGGDAFWHSRIGLFAGILLFGWALVSLMRHLQFSVPVQELIAYAFGLGLLAVAIEIVWRRPRAQPVSRRKAVLLTLFLGFLWLAWVANLTALLWLGIYILLLPRVVAGVGRFTKAYVGSYTGEGWRGTLTKVLVSRGARALVIIAAAAWLWVVSRSSVGAMSGEEVADGLIRGAVNAIIVLLVADLLWNLAKAYIDYRLEAATQAGLTNPEELARSGRLRTLLPILRNSLAVFIIVVAALTVLAGLGVQIAPLIAGAGIFGVALGFGSQTLVKDVLSGVFYMLDDAFRVGEYIQSGSYKGTVESFSLRSVRLRHHRGPVFTVPFGELGAVQNMSRDWVMEKWTINITYDSDVELARKLIKKIGAELAADPEYAASTLEPLKMQGVDSFGEFAVVLKLKLKTRPGEQFGIKRKALVMIKKAFEENGIKIAVPTVEVSGRGDSDAAVAQEVIRKHKATQSAAAGA
ncbi:mechanosensitive ion channel family protein [Arvimicrobium flavum]|uniref:mechanosensitive ion channel family protein n=1 Tax=Arvimicrobium flavum TaxID=3393320 RepID=UPI00237A0FAE|nr:mechanosensitive ion channel family protein [Mesorhizobium shangrilense]